MKTKTKLKAGDVCVYESGEILIFKKRIKNIPHYCEVYTQENGFGLWFGYARIDLLTKIGRL